MTQVKLTQMFEGSMMTEYGAGYRATFKGDVTLLFAIFAMCFTISCGRSVEQNSAPQELQSPVVATHDLIATQVQPAATDEEEQPKEDGQIPVEETSASQERNTPTPVAEQDPAESRVEPVETNEKRQPQLGAGGLPITRVPFPTVPLWQPDIFVARTPDASISVHKVIISPENITLIYSVELSEEYSFWTDDESPVATMQGDSRGAALAPLLSKVLRRRDEVSLGALSFGPYDADSVFYELVISEIRAFQASSGMQVTIQGPWTIPVLKQHDILAYIKPSEYPHLYFDGRSHSDRRDVEVYEYPGTYQGESPIGWITTGRIRIMGSSSVRFMVKPDGDVVEISRQQYSNMLDYVHELE